MEDMRMDRQPSAKAPSAESSVPADAVTRAFWAARSRLFLRDGAPLARPLPASAHQPGCAMSNPNPNQGLKMTGFVKPRRRMSAAAALVLSLMGAGTAFAGQPAECHERIIRAPGQYRLGPQDCNVIIQSKVTAGIDLVMVPRSRSRHDLTVAIVPTDQTNQFVDPVLIRSAGHTINGMSSYGMGVAYTVRTFHYSTGLGEWIAK